MSSRGTVAYTAPQRTPRGRRKKRVAIVMIVAAFTAFMPDVRGPECVSRKRKSLVGRPGRRAGRSGGLRHGMVSDLPWGARRAASRFRAGPGPARKNKFFSFEMLPPCRYERLAGVLDASGAAGRRRSSSRAAAASTAAKRPPSVRRSSDHAARPMCGRVQQARVEGQ